MTSRQFKVSKNQLYKKLLRVRKSKLMPKNSDLKDAFNYGSVSETFDAILELETGENN